MAGRLQDTILGRILQDNRPWGGFRQYTNNDRCTVKILTVDPNQVLSLQTHKHRDELWVFLDDGLRAQVDEEVIDARMGDEIVIPRGSKHRLASKGPRGRVLEIAFGDFDEDDIERLDDIYARHLTGIELREVQHPAPNLGVPDSRPTERGPFA